MHIFITGASGMIGSLVLNKCLADPKVSQVTSIVRRPGRKHAKLTEVVKQDFSHWQDVDLGQADAMIFCLGAYTGSVPTEELKRLTYTLPASLADALYAVRPDARFVLLSGQGADRKEKSRMAFARFKGMAENHIDQLGFTQFTSLRPGYIYPVAPRKEPNFSYRLMRKLYPIFKALGHKFSVTSEQLAAVIARTSISGEKQTILETQDIVQRAVSNP